MPWKSGKAEPEEIGEASTRNERETTVKSLKTYGHWIGLRENLQKTIVFTFYHQI